MEAWWLHIGRLGIILEAFGLGFGTPHPLFGDLVLGTSSGAPPGAILASFGPPLARFSSFLDWFWTNFAQNVDDFGNDFQENPRNPQKNLIPEQQESKQRNSGLQKTEKAKQTNKQTNERTNEQTNKQLQTKKQTNRQTYKQTNKQTHKETNKQASKLTIYIYIYYIYIPPK